MILLLNFKQYVAEIFAISKVRGVDTHKAFDLFRLDIIRGKGLNSYQVLPHFDFESLNKEWNKMEKPEQFQSIGEFNQWCSENYKELCQLFVIGEFEKMTMI